jgi:hypothetical protein
MTVCGGMSAGRRVRGSGPNDLGERGAWTEQKQIRDVVQLLLFRTERDWDSRTPESESKSGRKWRSCGMSCWLAGSFEALCDCGDGSWLRVRYQVRSA